MPERLGAFRIDGRLGAGGMGEVYRGWDERLDRPVAIKHVKADASDPERARQLFRREARAVARIQDAAIVQVYELLEEEDEDWLVMELVEGRSLRQLLADGPFQPRRAVAVARDVAAGLAVAHEAGIVHRDLKVDNVMVTDAGRSKILDFGIYKRMVGEDGSPLTTTISERGSLVGTVTAMSPEQAAGGTVDHRSDLFSFGTLLYELLAGRPPFLGENSHETLSRICLYKETPVRELNPELPESLSQLLTALLEKEPARRPQSAAEVREALDAISAELAGEESATLTPWTWAGTVSPVASDQPTADPWTAGASPRTPSGPTVRTLLLNDLVDSTKLVEKLGDERAASILEHHDRMARDILKANHGRENDKSDGFLMLFERPLDAVRFALGYHAALEEISGQEGVTVSSRVGIHIGEVVLRVNSPDDVARGAKPLEVEGLAKAMAARFMTLAGARQTLISRGVFDLGRRAAVGATDLPEALRWVEHGRYRMKGVEEPVEVFEAGVEGTSQLAAPADTKKVQAVVDDSRLLAGWQAKLVAAVLVLGLLGLAWFFLGKGPEPLAVAVRAPEIGTMDEAADGEIVASALRAALTRMLLNLENVSVTAPDQVDAIEGTSLDVARALAVDEVLTSKLDCTGTLCQVTVDRIRGAGGDVAWGGRFSAPIEGDLLELDNASAQALRRGFPKRPVRAGAPDLSVRAEDYTSYLRVLRQYRDEGRVEETLSALAAIQETSPRFLDAYLLEVDARANRLSVSHDPEDLEAGLAAVEKARGLDPQGQLPLLRLLDVALVGERLEIFEQALIQLEGLAPHDPRVMTQRAFLLERRGEHQEGLRMMRKAARRWGSFIALRTLAAMEYRQGLIDQARRHLLEALELNPGNFDLQTRLAQLELLNGDPRQAAEIYERLTEDSSAFGHLNNLGLAYLLLERYADAATAFRRLNEALPDSPILLLNLADTELLLGNAEESRALYTRILELQADDPIAESWQGLTIRAQSLAHLGQLDEAVAAARKAIRLAPDNPQVAYETALVFALAGEASSAMAGVEQAIEGGYEPRWFRIPWFEVLRDRARFKELVPEDPGG